MTNKEIYTWGDFTEYLEEFCATHELTIIDYGEGVMRASEGYITVAREAHEHFPEEELALIRAIKLARIPSIRNLHLVADYYWDSIKLTMQYHDSTTYRDWYDMDKFEQEFEEWYFNTGLRLIHAHGELTTLG